jgi:hypothetical protein
LLTENPLEILNKEGNIILKGVLWKELYEPILKNILGVIYPSASVKDLIKNKFQSEEDYRFKRLYRQTWFGIGISFLLGLFSVIFSLTNSCSDIKNKDILYKTIESINQHNLNSNQAILLELDSIKSKLQKCPDKFRICTHKNKTLTDLPKTKR